MALKKYACASVTGYKALAPTVDIKLPLRYPEKPQDLSANDRFNSLAATTGLLINFDSNLFLDLVAVDISNNMTAITLTPVVFENALRLPLQNLCINLPNKLVSHRAYSVSISPATSGEELDLIVDFIDERYLFTTVKINLADFIVGQAKTFSLEDFNSWGNISVPYSFELRSNPFFMKFIDLNNCIVSLKDGGMLHFTRPSPSADFDTYTFNEQSKFSLNVFGGIFGGNNAANGCVVDLVQVGDLIITLSVNKLLKVWDLKGHNLLKTLEIGSGDSFLTTIPSKYLYHLVKDGRDFVVFHNTNLSEVDQGAEFKLFEVDNYQDISIRSFTIDLPKFGDDYRNKIWFIQDFQITLLGENVNLYLLWKSNISSLLINYTVDINNLQVKQSYESEIESIDDCLQDYEQEYYYNQIMTSGLYDELTLRTSVNILRERLDLPPFSNKQELLIKETVKALQEKQDSDSLKTPESNHQDPWFILNSLCEQYKNLSKESLTLSLYKEDIIILQTNGLGFFRPLCGFEQFQNDQNDTFNVFLQQISIELSNKTIYKVYQYIMGLDKIESSHLAYISETLLGGKFVEDVEKISEVLNNYPNVLDKIQSLINSPPSDTTGYENQLSTITKTYIISSFKDLIQKHKHLLLELMILFSKFDEEDNLLNFSNAILTKLKNFRTLEMLFGDHHDQSIIWNQLMAKGDVINKYNYLNSKVDEQEYMINIIITLINQGLSQFILDNLLGKIDVSVTSNKFLKGLILLMNKDLNSIEVLTYPNFQQFLTSFDITKFSNPIGEFLTANQKSNEESKYYHNLSEFILKETATTSFMQASIDLELKAIGLTSDNQAIELYYENIFQNSIKLFNIEIILQALQNLQSSNRFRTYLKFFITKLIEHDSINKLFTQDEDFLQKNFKIIDLILVELANNESLLNSIKFYEILYSWRINNHLVRQGIEALYWFIARFEGELNLSAQETSMVLNSNLKVIYLKILEFYLIILNCLKSFTNDSDKWLIKYVADDNQLVSLQELNGEYLNYLKRLNSL